MGAWWSKPVSFASGSQPSLPPPPPDSPPPPTQKPAPVAARPTPRLPTEVWAHILAVSQFDVGEAHASRATVQSLALVDRRFAQLAAIAYPEHYGRVASRAAAHTMQQAAGGADIAQLVQALRGTLAKAQLLHLQARSWVNPNAECMWANTLIKFARPNLRALAIVGLAGQDGPDTDLNCFAEPFAQLQTLFISEFSAFAAAFRAHHRAENFASLVNLYLYFSHANSDALEPFALHSPSVRHLVVDEHHLGEHPLLSTTKLALPWPKLASLTVHTGGASIFDQAQLVAPALRQVLVRDDRGGFGLLARIDWSLWPTLDRLVLVDDWLNPIDAPDVIDALAPAKGHVHTLDLSNLHMHGDDLLACAQLLGQDFAHVVVATDEEH